MNDPQDVSLLSRAEVLQRIGLGRTWLQDAVDQRPLPPTHPGGPTHFLVGT